MVSKTSKIAIIDATQKGESASRATTKKKREPQNKKAVEKTQVLDVQKGFFFSGKKSDLSSAFKGASENASIFTHIPSSIKAGEKEKKARVPLSKKQETKGVSKIAISQKGKQKDKTESRKSLSWMSKIPDTLPGRMRIVAYIGIVYIVLGVCGVSYALADMYGSKFSHSMPLTALMQKANTIESYYTKVMTSGTQETITPSVDTITDTQTVPIQDPIPTTTSNDTTTESLRINVPLATSTATNSEEEEVSDTAESLSPPITLSFSEKMPLQGKIMLSLSVAHAEKIELALLPHNALTPYYLGRAYKVPEGESAWRFAWNTINIPNGTYYLVAHVKNKYGTYTSEKKYIGILNPVADATETEEKAPSLEVTEAVTTIETDMPSPLRPLPPTPTERARPVQKEEPSNFSEDSGEIEKPVAASTEQKEVRVDRKAPLVETEATEAKRSEDVLHIQRTTFKNQLLLLIERFAVAYRAKDLSVQEYIQKEISALKEESIAKLKKRSTLTEEEITRLAQEFDALIAGEISRIETRERMITERVGDAVAKDSDNDGVVDYDEVTLYKTDPVVADSDNDGFTDGAEIMSGYDPRNADRETMVAFENPESEGLVREDILAVASIETERTEEKVVGARLSGKGLPNSFVTLYVFSTPVVITVRTNEDGSWSYIFDKELEDGAHTVYVGITDNAGRIVAKSNPFAFVKTAEAFTGQTAEGVEGVAVVEEPELLSPSALLLVGALVLTLLGSALVALGAYFMRPQEYVVASQFA